MVGAIIIRRIISCDRLNTTKRAQHSRLLLRIPRFNVCVHMVSHGAMVPLGLSRLLILIVMTHILMFLHLVFGTSPNIIVIDSTLGKKFYVLLLGRIINI